MRTVDENLGSHEEKFSLISLRKHVKGKLIFETVNDELVLVCTDGAGYSLKNNFEV